MKKSIFRFHFIPLVVVFNEKFDCKVFEGAVDNFQMIFFFFLRVESSFLL